MNCHHRADGEGVHIPVGESSKIESREGCLRWPYTCFQHLLDCAVPSEDTRVINLLYLVGFYFDCIKISIGSSPISRIDDQSNSKWNGVPGHSFLPLSHRVEQVSTSSAKLSVRLLKYFLGTLIGQSSISFLSYQQSPRKIALWTPQTLDWVQREDHDNCESYSELREGKTVARQQWHLEEPWSDVPRPPKKKKKNSAGKDAYSQTRKTSDPPSASYDFDSYLLPSERAILGFLIHNAYYL